MNSWVNHHRQGINMASANHNSGYFKQGKNDNELYSSYQQGIANSNIMNGSFSNFVNGSQHNSMSQMCQGVNQPSFPGNQFQSGYSAVYSNQGSFQGEVDPNMQMTQKTDKKVRSERKANIQVLLIQLEKHFEEKFSELYKDTYSDLGDKIKQLKELVKDSRENTENEMLKIMEKSLFVFFKEISDKQKKSIQELELMDNKLTDMEENLKMEISMIKKTQNLQATYQLEEIIKTRGAASNLQTKEGLILKKLRLEKKNQELKEEVEMLRKLT